MSALSPAVQAATLQELFEASVAATPDALAVTTDGVSLSYRALADRAASITARLAALGVGPDVIVGLLAGRSNELVAGLIGILGAGGAYLPLDASHPADRWRLVLEDAGAGIVVCSSQFAEGMRRSGMQVVLLDDDDDRPAVAVAPPTSRACAENLAYVIYTSGSTGRPKGVMVTHRNVVRLLRSTEGWFGFRSDDVWTLFHSIAFDFSVWEVWGALAYGGRLVVVPQAVTRDPLLFLQLLDREEVTVLNQTPSAFRALIEAEARSGDAEHLASLRWVVFGGEALPMHLLRAWYDRHPEGRPRLMNMYGITETTVHVTGRELSAADVDGPSVIGDPIPDLRIELLDDRLEAVEDGRPGEIVVSGAGVALGYLGLPDLTAERFVPDPSSPGARRYRSGDLGRRLPDGDLEYLGRIDQQVKIRGHRVEPGEVEAVAAAHPLVAAVAVVPFASADGTALAAFVVSTDRGDRPIEGLRAWFGGRLPAALVPARIVSVPALPLTPNGKLDRGRLLELLPQAAGAGPPPRPGTEATLAGIWSELLVVERIGRDDDFFDLGGNSLAAIRLVTRIDRLTGVRVPVRSIFEHPVLADLAEVIDAALSARAHDTPAMSVVPALATTELELPAMPAQRGMCMLHEHLAERSTYNQPYAFRLSKALDEEDFLAALRAMQARHPGLRTALLPTPVGPMQRVEPAGAIDVDWHVEPAVGPHTIDAALREHARRPFDLARAPLWRATYFPSAATHGVMLFVFHHAIVDEWSTILFFRDMASWSGGSPALPPLPACRLDPPTGARRDQLFRFWRNELAGAPAAVGLPGAGPVDGEGTAGATVRRTIPEVAGKLRRAARETRCTVAQWLLGVFHAWLHRVTLATDIVVVTPSSLRAMGVPEDAFGCFLTTVPIRVRWDDDTHAARPAEGMALPEVVQRVGRSMIDAGDHADLPFDEIAAAAGRRGRQSARLADILVVMRNRGWHPGRLNAAGLEPLDCDTATAKFGATFFLDVSGDDVEIAVEYATAVYDGAVVSTHLSTLEAFLGGAIADPGAMVESLSLGGPGTRRGGASDRRTVGESRPPIHASALGFARIAPHLPAVIAGPTKLSFAQLDDWSRALAARLMELGSASEERVGICLPRGASSCVTLLGVLRAGGACVPLDPSLPAERLRRMVAIAGVRFVVCTEATASLVAGLDGTVAVRVDGIPAAPHFVDPDVGSERLAYVLFTSGSTGDPKGVEMPHGPLAALFTWQARSTPRDPGGRTLHFASTGFDVAFQEVFSAWQAGCAVVVAGDDVRRDPARLVELVSRERVDRMMLPTAMLVPFAEAALASGTVPTVVRDVIVAGERLHVTDTVRRLFEALPGCRLWNQYGPTETHVVTAHLLEGPPSAWPDHPPIGRPIDGAEVTIVGPSGTALPPGCVGEIVLGGGCLARGYASRPDLTAERFPFDAGTVPPSRRYRTGDLGWIRPDGVIECLGRNDRQIKISGHRIEPGEIEAALAACPGVRRAAVIVRHDGASSAGMRLVAFLEIGPGWLGATATRSRLRTTLSEPMVPAVLTPLADLPTNVNGKIDRKALAALPITDDPQESSAGWDLPRGAVESIVAEEWSRILAVPRVSREDDFFSLGGHSLPAMMFVAAIDDRIGVRIPVRTVFERPRLADLAAAIEEHRGTPPHAASEPDASTEAAAIPALPAQRGMWLLREILPDPAAYNQPVALRPTRPVDWEAFRLRLAAAMNRHPALRASLVMEDGVLLERRAAAGTLPMPWIVEPDVRPDAIDGVLRDRARVPFDLGQAPLWRATLFPDASTDGVLLLLFHHAIIDDWSIRTLLSELADGDSAAPATSTVPASQPPEAAERDRAYWSRFLAGAPAAVPWPSRGGPPPAPRERGAIVRLGMPAEVVGTWQRIARDSGGTLFHAWLGACHVWLQRVGGCDDSVVLTPVTTRISAGVQAAVGCHLNTLPTRLRRGDVSATAEAMTAAVRSTFLDALDHGGLPFDEIVACVPGASGHGTQPLANAMFVLLDERSRPATIDGVPVESIRVHTGTARFDLTLAIVLEPDGGAEIGIEYALDALDEKAVRAMGRRLLLLLEAVAADPDVALDTLDLLDATERSVIASFAGDSFPRDERATLLSLVGVARSRSPDAAAIRDGERRWTRDALDRDARAIARRLRACGVGPGTRVGVAVPRSAEYVAVVLGILRAGGAWVPLDVAAAPTRAAFIAADADLVAVVSAGPPGIPLPPRVPLLDVGGDWPAADSVDGAEDAAVDPSAPAYVIYTSGSTGKPKGVVVSHASAVSFVRAMQCRHPLSENDSFLFSTGTTFDIAVYEVFGALASGAAIVVTPAGVPDPEVIADLLVEAGVTIAQFVPSFLDVLVARDVFAGSTRLRRVFCGGEALSSSLARRFHSASAAELVNGYGPTEATIWATSWSCEEEDGDVGIPIGRPLDNVRARILDSAGRLLPVGAPGELFLGGPQLAVGYLGRAALTAERFVADPRGGVGARLYRTGDLCRWREDGAIEYLGRLDDQVKIRGHRVELGEIEACLAEHPLVERAAACVKRGGDGEVEVVGFVIGDAAIGDGSAVVAHATGRLPSVMVPARVVRVDGFPVNANGKLDRKALLESDPGPATRPSPGPAVPAGGRRLSGLEMTILAAWQRSFSRHDVGLDENFFDLGGNSLRAITLVADVSSALGRRVSVATVFRAPTVRGMAGLLGSGAWQPRFRSLVPLQPLGEGPALFFVHGVSGGVSTHVDVARHLAPTVPVHGLQAVDLDGHVAPHRSVAEMVRHYAAEIRAFQPDGPYYLGGFCLGAYLAYETARQLREEGAEVSAVFVEDALPSGRLPLGVRARYLAAWIPEALVRHAGRLSHIAPWHWGRYVYERTPYGRESTAPADDEDGFDLATNRYFRLARGHRCGPLDADLVLLLSDQMADSAVAAWRALVSGRVEVRRVRAPHEGFTVAGAPAIAEVIRATFECRRRARSASEQR